MPMPRIPSILALASSLGACGGLTPLEVQKDIGPNLVQVVHVSDVNPARGDTIEILSTVRNSGPDIVVEAFVCIELSGMELERAYDPVFGCEGGGMPLPEGDSLMSGGAYVVHSPAGMYTVTVHHLMDPDVFVEFSLTVKE